MVNKGINAISLILRLLIKPIRVVINDLDKKTVSKRLDPVRFLPQDKGLNGSSEARVITDNAHNNTLNVGILYCEETAYSMIHSLYYAFSGDNRFNTEIILQGKPWGNNFVAISEQLSKKNISFRYDFECRNTLYDVIFAHHEELPPTSDIRYIIDNARWVFSCGTGVINYTSKGISNRFLKDYKVRALFLEENLSGINSDKGIMCYVTGNPKFDYVYEACNSSDYYIPKRFNKLLCNDIKKVILWTTDHIGTSGVVSPEVSFDLYAKGVFEYFNKHRNMGLIFRPFRPYIEENLRNGIWNTNQVKQFRDYCDNCPNVVWDDEPEYGASFRIADAILSDVGCGFICEALPTGKPVGIPLRWDCNCNKLISYNKEIVSNHYLFRSVQELTAWFDMVDKGEDYKKEERENIAKKYVTSYDGRNAERIKQIIVEKYIPDIAVGV